MVKSITWKFREATNNLGSKAYTTNCVNKSEKLACLSVGNLIGFSDATAMKNEM